MIAFVIVQNSWGEKYDAFALKSEFVSFPFAIPCSFGHKLSFVTVLVYDVGEIECLFCSPSRLQK